jgi:hypothetical protein
LVVSIAWARYERRYLKMLGQPVVPADEHANPSDGAETGDRP